MFIKHGKERKRERESVGGREEGAGVGRIERELERNVRNGKVVRQKKKNGSD